VRGQWRLAACSLWLVAVVVFARRTLRADYFRQVVVAADPRPWAWLHRRFGVEEAGQLALYRGLLFYGACRIAAWTIQARFVVHAPLDLRWGGPRYVRLVDLSDATAPEVALECLRGAVLLAALLAVAWPLVLRPLWHRAASG
jgi:hypothetical protein